jgi:CHASE2 domain-containing sensor protein
VTASVLVNVCALLLLPLVWNRFGQWSVDISWIFFAALTAAITGWAARAPRLATLAGAVSVPAVLFVSYCYARVMNGPGYWLSTASLVLSLLSLCPLCATTAHAASRLREWAERLAGRERLTSPIR